MSSLVVRFDPDLPEAAVIYLLHPIESCVDSKASNMNHYMAPEGGISFSGDVFALGKVMIELLTGHVVPKEIVYWLFGQYDGFNDKNPQKTVYNPKIQ
jgi:hypothetical protein